MDESTTGLLQSSQNGQYHQTSSSSIDSIKIDPEQLLNDKPKDNSRKIPRWIIYLAAALLVLVGIIELVVLVGQLNRVASSKIRPFESVTWKHCGNSAQEALQNNCVLDFIAGAWVPRECYDAELEAEFLQLKNWRWYADNDGEHELSIESIRQNGGPNPIFVTLEYHWVHCSYTWRKLHRSRIFQTPIDTHIGEYEHTAHCATGLAAQCYSNDTRPVSEFYHHFESCVA
jgi:hypothetical protein